jgi:hypothetical protein
MRTTLQPRANSSLRRWWDNLTHFGAPFGYHANASKTWLIVKGSALAQAHDIFSNTAINITSEGRPYLGAALGSQEYINQYVSDKVQKWNEELHILSEIATTQPHAAFAAFTHGFIHKFRFLCRVIPDIDHVLQPLEDCIRCRLIPAITGRDPQTTSSETSWPYPHVRVGWAWLTLQPWPPLSMLPHAKFQVH